MGISRIFDLSRRGMATYQSALDVTSHNIANASNPQFSRQQVILSTETPEVVNGFTWGTGVKLDQINRVRNDLTDAQLRQNYSNYNSNFSSAELLGQVEQLFTEPSDLGLSNLMSNFFSSWQELAVTPNSSTLRTNVVNAAVQISTKVKSINDGLDVIKSDIISDTRATVETLNGYVQQVQLLNQQIFEAETIGNSASDLQDKRDAAIDEISKLVNVSISYDDNKSALISFGGVFAADRSNYVNFKIEENNGKLQLVSENGAVVKLTGGELKGKTDVYTTYVPEYQAKLNNVISTLVETVNAEHSKGYSLGNPPRTGIEFFGPYQNGNLKISQEILDDTNLIAASADGNNGNGDAALKIGDISSKGLIQGTTLNDAYASFISKMGTDINKLTQTYEGNKLAVEQLEEQKASYSAVSIDEEMANVIKYQKSYTACAKLIGIADDMLETILGLVR